MRNKEAQPSDGNAYARRIAIVPDRAVTILLVIVLGLLLCAFTGAMLSEDIQAAIGKYLGLTKKTKS